MTVVEERSPAHLPHLSGLHDWTARRERVLVAAAVGVAVVAGSVLAVRSGTTLKIADERQYEAIARHLADHGRYSIDGGTPTAYRPPVWPVVLAAIRLIGLNVVAARLFNVLCLAGAVVGVWRLARRVAAPGTEASSGVLAALACAVYPTFLYAAATLYPQSLGTALLVAMVLAALNAVDAFAGVDGDRRRGLRFAALTGLLAGLLVLTVPVFAGTAVLVVVWFAVALRRKAVPVACAFLGVALLLPVAWAIRNEVRMRALIPVSTSDGVNLLLGNSEHAGPGTGTLTDISGYLATVQQRGLGETAQDHYYRSAALTWIGHHPGGAAVLYLEKTAHYFSFRDQLAGSAQPSPLQSAVLAAAFLPVLALVAIRLARIRGRPLTRDEVLIIGLFLLSSLFMAVFFTRVRFRMPLDTMAIAVAAATLAGATGRRTPGEAEAESSTLRLP